MFTEADRGRLLSWLSAQRVRINNRARVDIDSPPEGYELKINLGVCEMDGSPTLILRLVEKEDGPEEYSDEWLELEANRDRLHSEMACELYPGPELGSQADEYVHDKSEKDALWGG